MLIKAMPDYAAWPLWVKEDGDDIFTTRDPATLGLSGSLVGRLAAWQQWYESMVNFADPGDSRTVMPAEDRANAVEGRLLATRVGAELPGAVVWYYEDPQPGSPA